MAQSQAQYLDQTEIDHLVRLSKKQYTDGVIYEPRAFFDSFDFDGVRTMLQSTSDVFRNGEKWPVRITHFAWSIRPTADSESNGDERMIQRFGAQVRAHDAFYMSARPQGVLLPLWHNVPIAGDPGITNGTISWTFERPFILGNRDTMVVRCRLEQTPTVGTDPPVPAPRPVEVAFSGFGMLSKRPYIISGRIELDDTNEGTIDPDLYRNEGDEPIVIVEMTAFCGAPYSDGDPTADIGQLRLRIRQSGNGTSAWWMDGRNDPANLFEHCPALCLGPTMGRAVVHELPTDPNDPRDKGILWYPNDGMTVDMFQLGEPAVEHVSMSMLGYAIIT